MIRKRIGSLFVVLFFLAVLTGGIIYDDLSASSGTIPTRRSSCSTRRSTRSRTSTWIRSPPTACTCAR